MAGEVCNPLEWYLQTLRGELRARYTISFPDFLRGFVKIYREQQDGSWVLAVLVVTVVVPLLAVVWVARRLRRLFGDPQHPTERLLSEAHRLWMSDGESEATMLLRQAGTRVMGTFPHRAHVPPFGRVGGAEYSYVLNAQYECEMLLGNKDEAQQVVEWHLVQWPESPQPIWVARRIVGLIEDERSPEAAELYSQHWELLDSCQQLPTHAMPLDPPAGIGISEKQWLEACREIDGETLSDGRILRFDWEAGVARAEEPPK